VVDKAEAEVELPAKACPAWVMPNADGAGYFRVSYAERAAIDLRDKGWAKLTVAERRAVAFDLNTGALDGSISFDTALSLVPKLMAKLDRHALSLATQPTAFAPYVPTPLQRKYERYLRTMYGKAATAVGLLPKPGDSLDDELMRKTLVDVVAWSGRDPKLIAQATKLAKKWRELPQAMRGLILRIAVDKDPALFEQVLAEVPTEADRALRDEMMNAVIRVRDPGRAKQALGLVLDPALDIRESIELGRSMSTPETQEVAHVFYREHAAEILKRAPTSTTSQPFAKLSVIWTRPCRAETREAVAAEIEATFSTFPSAPRIIAQVLESMDQCITQRARLGPAVEQWLKKQ
jgi:alanyl aminopeptidase